MCTYLFVQEPFTFGVGQVPYLRKHKNAHERNYQLLPVYSQNSSLQNCMWALWVGQSGHSQAMGKEAGKSGMCECMNDLRPEGTQPVMAKPKEHPGPLGSKADNIL